VTASGKTAELGAAGKIAEKIFSNNKVSKVTEDQAAESTGEGTVSKTISSTTTEQKTNSTKKPSGETTIAKKPASETAIAKKPTVEHTPSSKPRPSKENLPVQQAATPNSESNNQNSNNKAIDVPYRYSE